MTPALEHRWIAVRCAVHRPNANASLVVSVIDDLIKLKIELF
jgi:hypothetical protein